MLQTKLYMLILALWIIKDAAAFLLEDNCPAPSPCTCSGSSSSYAYIYCTSKSLTEIPRFKPSTHHVDTLYLYLYGNSINGVSAHIFRNLSSINASNVQIQLYNNDISQIDDDAFVDFENTSTVILHLQNNNLSALPIATTKLKGLVYLDIRDNPIRTLDSSIMASLGSSLTTLAVDLELFTEWPRELRHLNLLHSLNVQDVPFAHLETDIFHGFENSLTSVTFDHSKLLEKIPFAICTLPKLQSLTFNNSPQLKENRSSVFEHCRGRHPSVTSLTLNQDGLSIFPDIFHLFPSLTSLNLRYNNLELIETEKVPSHNYLTSIYLHSNKFKRIPSVFHKIKSLNTIGLSSNEIISVEDFDLNFLKDLTSLNLNNNPLRYISPNAFKGNQKLYTLQLQNTQLFTVSAAVLSVPSLRNLYMSGTSVECSCDMSYLKHWNVTAISYFNGQCLSSAVELKTYIKTSLQQCP